MKSCLLLLVSAFVYHQAVSQSLQWSNPVAVANGASYGSTRPRITVCNGVPVVVWSDAFALKVYASRFNGASFSSPVLVTPPGFAAFAADWTGAEIDSKDDLLFVTFTDNVIPPGPAYLVRSNDGGMTFDDTVRVPLLNGEVPRFPKVQAMPDTTRW